MRTNAPVPVGAGDAPASGLGCKRDTHEQHRLRHHTGAFGTAYFIYGKRQARFVPLIAGMLLCVYPYFVDSVLWLAVVGIALLAAPFLIDF
ncbi:MAG TPA: hypothetical protein VLU54_13050 [Casimicrobiaceae bacterium]|nr:hypothetical protein [Casimicrobiaceae bacterium]